jgi:hypothetical protein
MPSLAAPPEQVPERVLPDMVALSPTGLEHWLTCPRLYLNADVLDLPGSDPGPPRGHGLLVHDLLRHLHRRGSCAEAPRGPSQQVAELLEAHACDDRVGAYLSAHVRRCPAGATSLGHEREFARFHRFPGPIFMAVGRIDALWAHDGLLDARDYKTGMAVPAAVADDPKARLQAFLLARLAAREGLRLQIRYECLAPEVVEDPEPFEPDDGVLGVIEEELRQVVAAMRADRAFAGVAEPGACRHCHYRSICPDSVARPR